MCPRSSASACPFVLLPGLLIQPKSPDVPTCACKAWYRRQRHGPVTSVPTGLAARDERPRRLLINTMQQARGITVRAPAEQGCARPCSRGQDPIPQAIALPGSSSSAPARQRPLHQLEQSWPFRQSHAQSIGCQQAGKALPPGPSLPAQTTTCFSSPAHSTHTEGPSNETRHAPVHTHVDTAATGYGLGSRVYGAGLRFVALPPVAERGAAASTCGRGLAALVPACAPSRWPLDDRRLHAVHRQCLHLHRLCARAHADPEAWPRAASFPRVSPPCLHRTHHPPHD